MLAVLAKANAKAGERNKTRWKKDREHMTKIAARNAQKGTAALTGRKFSAARLQAHSAALTGRLLGGKMKKGPSNIRAMEFSLRDPNGKVWTGRNILHFVREHVDMFCPEDVKMKRGTCNAAKALSRVALGDRQQWKEWRYAEIN